MIKRHPRKGNDTFRQNSTFRTLPSVLIIFAIKILSIIRDADKAKDMFTIH
eukprot:TRINITY_DN13661_c0_g1_i1.p3 TRINITY_DN13661_c0_g1~~TRINITY_DN13661_c0_g1_i1.p3  ORF type:complete len:51 (-),score=5.00 TRINITY_DN13661_c0_g1_i1:330-482(-)